MMLGGLALFLLGTTRIASSLENAAGPATRRWMSAATSSPFKALLTGTGVSAVTQSGTATAVTTLGMVASGLVPAAAALAMSLGAKLGATVAIQLAAFDIAQYALPMIGVGFVLTLWRRSKVVGEILLGAGLLFFGLDLTVEAIGGLSESEVFSLLVDASESQPLALLVLGTVLGAALGSANASAAVAIGLVLSDTVSLPTALALIVGGNVGSTVLPLLVSRSLDASAQRVALSHFIVKGLGALAVVFAAQPLVDVIARLGGDGARQVANAHTLFNLAVALLVTPLAGPLVALSRHLVPTGEDDSAPKYLREESLAEPSLAIKLALRETVRISDQVAVMTELAVGYVKSGKWDPTPIESREAKVDKLTHEVVDYLARLRRSSDDEDATSERLLLAATELEHMGDQIRRLYRREEKLREAGIEFSKQGRSELGETGELVLERMRVSFTALATGDCELARQVVRERPGFEDQVARMRLAHLARLEARLPESRASSSHHLEVLTLLRQLDASITRVAAWTREIYDAAPTADAAGLASAVSEGGAPRDDRPDRGGDGA